MASGSATAAEHRQEDPWFPGLVEDTATRCEHPTARGRRPRGPPTALDWLSVHQRPDGGFARDGDPEGPADLPATGLAILAFLAQGEMPKHGEHRSVVQRGLRYLKGVQNPGGCFGPPEATVFPLAHAIATAAMVEAWRLTASPLFRRSAQEALDHITRRGDSPPPWESGTRVGPGDAVATAWLARATLHAALGRLDLPPWTIDRLRA